MCAVLCQTFQMLVSREKVISESSNKVFKSQHRVNCPTNRVKQLPRCALKDILKTHRFAQSLRRTKQFYFEIHRGGVEPLGAAMILISDAVTSSTHLAESTTSNKSKVSQFFALLYEKKTCSSQMDVITTEILELDLLCLTDK